MRILVADDDAGVLSAYRMAFSSEDKAESDLSALAASLFSGGAEAPAQAEAVSFDVTYVEQGEAAAAAIAQSVAEGSPFQVVFLDMRMPPASTAKRPRGAFARSMPTSISSW
ncbi:MAG: hypothetical protein AB7Q23_08390 [Hyphomonadaceae bacterium]